MDFKKLEIVLLGDHLCDVIISTRTSLIGHFEFLEVHYFECVQLDVHKFKKMGHFEARYDLVKIYEHFPTIVSIVKLLPLISS